MKYYFADEEGEHIIFYVTDVYFDYEHKVWKGEFTQPDSPEKLVVEGIIIGNKFLVRGSDTGPSRSYLLSDLPEVVIHKKSYNVFAGFAPKSSNTDMDAGNITKMPGKISKIFVRAGECVKKGDLLYILEAMKMENEVKSTVDAVVDSVNVKEGDVVEQGVSVLYMKSEGK